MKKAVILTIVILLSGAFLTFGQQVGNAGPDFEVNLLGGGTFKLSDQQGKVVLVYLFGNTCPYCISSGPMVESSINQVFKDNENFTAVGLDTWDGSSNTASVTAFRNSTGITFPLAIKAGHVATSYQTDYDHLMVIDHNGILVHKGFLTAGNDINNAKAAIATSLASIEPDPCESAGILIEETVYQPLCGEDTVGSIKINVGGKNAPLSISWFNDSEVDSISGLSEGCYHVEVTDDKGCMEQKEICLTIPDPLVVELDKTDLTCYRDNSGTISIEAFGGTPPYLKMWNAQEVESVLENLGAGEYAITVLDANECMSDVNITLSEPDEIPLGEISGTEDVEAYATYTYSVPENENNTFNWSVAGGSIVSGQGTHIIEVQWGPNTEGTVETVAEAESGCFSDTARLVVNIMKSTGYESFPDQSNFLYPNPVRDVLFVSSDIEVVVSIYDMTGALRITTSQKRIGLSSLNTGTYFVSVKSQDFIRTRMILKY